MKKAWIWTFLTLLLCGCAAGLPEEPAPMPASQGPRERLPLQKVAAGECIALCPIGSDLLILSEGDGTLRLSRLSHETLATTADAEVASSVSCLQVLGDRVCFHDPVSRRTLVLGEDLRELTQIPDPPGLTGSPRLSEDRKRLYYCTGEAVRVLELDTGTDRLLKADPAEGKTVAGLLLDGTVIHCRCEDPVLGSRSLFLSAETGQTLAECEALRICSQGQFFYAETASALLFGDSQRMLAVEGEGVLLPLCHRAVTWETAASGTELSCVDLETGQQTAKRTLPSSQPPRSLCATEEGAVFFLLDQALWVWEPALDPVEDPAIRTAPYFSAADPDTEGLTLCREEARRISERFGIRVLIWTDATRLQPEDCQLEPEHRVEVLRQELRLLEERLARYPEGFLQKLSDSLGQLTICLVRSLSTVPEGGLQGIQFRQGDRCFLVLLTDTDNERTLYHLLCHGADSRVLTYSHAYDDWESLSPGDFEYDLDYARNAQRDGSAFLRDTSRSFVDTFSMSFPREDRARIMEYAMTAGNAALFSAPILQQKLTKLCTGLREAFALEDYPAPLPWEQYLLKPLAPASRE